MSTPKLAEPQLAANSDASAPYAPAPSTAPVQRSEAKLAPLNHPACGPSGVQDDGGLICVWGDPAADTTHLVTTVTAINRGPALILLNQLADSEGFLCYTPDQGTRCEKTWQNTQYPVTDGRTLYWRDDILTDTQYSNLAPRGYNTSIIESIFS